MDNMQFVLDTLLESRQMVAKMNTNTAQLEFICHEDPAIPLNTPLDGFQYFTDYLNRAIIMENDAELFQLLLDLKALREICAERKNGILFSYRRMSGDELVWTKVILRIPADYSAEKPDVLLLWRDLTQVEMELEDASQSINSRIEKIIKCDLSVGSFRVLKQPRGEKAYRIRSDADMLVEEEFVYHEDVALFRSATDYDHVIAFFLAGNTEKTVYYRRRSGGQYRWVKLIIRTAREYTLEHPVFWYFIVDIHRAMTNFFSEQGRNSFLRRHSETTKEIESYYENVINVVSFLTQKYIDFYLVDLVNDRYVKYKTSRNVLEGNISYVGTFSTAARGYMEKLLERSELQRIQQFTSPDVLREILSDKVTFSYVIVLRDGRTAKTTCTKCESSHGIPTKVICQTVILQNEKKLRVKTFGSFAVFDQDGKEILFSKMKSKQLLAYLVDKYGFPVSTTDLVTDVLEKPADDLNAKKYVSTLFRAAAKDLEAAGYAGIIIKEWNSLRVNTEKLDCDYYHLMEGDISYWEEYHNEYMKEYSWAEETNAEILQIRN